MTSTVCFPLGNLAPEGSVIKSTAIDPSVLDADGVYRFTGPAKVFITEPSAMAAIRDGRIQAGDVLVLACRGPMGAGMEETYQLTSALRYLPFGKHVAIVTDARFSGVSTGACIGHVSPEALAADRSASFATATSSGSSSIGARWKDRSISSARTAPRLASRPVRGFSTPGAAHRPRVLIRSCPTTRASGPRCRTPAAGPGAGASSTSTRSCRSWRREEKALGR